jgi:acyl-CoA dehydrogenase
VCLGGVPCLPDHELCSLLEFRISIDTVYPDSFLTLTQLSDASEQSPDSRFRILIEFFQRKGLDALKNEDRTEEWQQDWIEYQAKHQLYASLLSPSKYSHSGRSLNLLTLMRFWETFAFLSPSHAYSLHVTFLGLFPILMSKNEPLKIEAIAKLEEGGLFAFGISEKAHGADLLANESFVSPTTHDGELVSGSKYYIGNANCASVITVLAKEVESEVSGKTRRAPFVLFALRPRESPAFQNLRKIRTLGVRTAFVGAFEIKNHFLPDRDVVSRGREAWNAVAITVTFGKFFLGFGAIGICAHSFAEAIDHLLRRVLYGQPTTELPHIRAMVTCAFARLTAMRLFAYRALDYLQAASDDDRRFLLFNAVQKAKVSTQGVEVMNLLSECIGARGFEADTYFEGALREAPMIPSLEGSTHINLRLTCQFMNSYFAASRADLVSPPSLLLGEAKPFENLYWFAAKERNPKSVVFSDYRRAFEPLRPIANVRALLKQCDTFRRFVGTGLQQRNDNTDAAILIAIGRCFSTIVYAQLIAEMCNKAQVPFPIVSVMFSGFIEDLSAGALKLAAFFVPGSRQRNALKKVIRIPRTSDEDFTFLFDTIALRYGRRSIGRIDPSAHN